MRGLWFLIVILSITENVFSQENVLFGEQQNYLPPAENTTRIFLDKNGDYYPNEIISNELLLKNSASLKDTYKNVTAKSSTVTFDEFQQQIIAEKLAELKQDFGPYTKLFVLIHGFRKILVSANGDISAHDEYEFLKARVNEKMTSQNHFVEIYWDGMYMRPQRSLKSGMKLGKLFKKSARSNAEQVGMSLRKFISEIDHEELTIISHSLGAEVVINLLYNAREQCDHKTPSQSDINIILAAPAVSKKPFKRFYKRKATVDFISKDNYRLTILYNEQDFVLSKATTFLGMRIEFSRLYGNTRLGCNCRNEALELEKKFGKLYPNSSILLVHGNSFGGSHRANDYFGSRAFQTLLER